MCKILKFVKNKNLNCENIRNIRKDFSVLRVDSWAKFDNFCGPIPRFLSFWAKRLLAQKKAFRIYIPNALSFLFCKRF